MTYFERQEMEKDIIHKAYTFEINAIEKGNADRNPWFNEIKSWNGGDLVWNEINVAVELYMERRNRT